jgi:thioredoxin reductase
LQLLQVLLVVCRWSEINVIPRFAIGDATDADPRKLVLPAVSQAEVAARNVRAVLEDDVARVRGADDGGTQRGR